MLLNVKNKPISLIRYFQTSSISRSKANKRRKETRLKLSPNLQNIQGGVKPAATKLAIDFFDGHYKQVYGSDWHSIRLALYSKPKFAAMVNNFSAKDEIMENLVNLGCVNIKDLYYQGMLTTQVHFPMSLNKA